MDDQVHLFEELLEKSKKILVPMGVWPSHNNRWITIANIVILVGYSILVLVKNLLNPEGESIENAFTLGNAGLITVLYFVTMLKKKKEFMNFFELMKTNEKQFSSNEAKRLMIAGGQEYQKISNGFLFLLPAMVLVRFIQPSAQYAYIMLFSDDKTFSLPPPMGVPVFLFGEILTYVIESVIRMVIFSTLIAACLMFIISILYICTQYNILAMQLRSFKDKDDDAINKIIANHQVLLNSAKLVNDVFSPYFFADCLFSLINLTIMMFSLLAHNASLQNFLLEVPLVTTGMSQLFFVLYFGDRLIDAVSMNEGVTEGDII